VASFALNSTGLGHASRLVAIHAAVRRRGVASIFFTEHRTQLIDDYGFEQVVLPPYQGSLLGDDWWNRDEGTPATTPDAPGLSRMIIDKTLCGRLGVALHDVVFCEPLYRWAARRGWPQAYVYRPRADVAEPASWLAERAPGVGTMYLIGDGGPEAEPAASPDGRIAAIWVSHVRRRPQAERSVWDGADTSAIRVTVSAGGGGHADAGAFVNAAVMAIAHLAASTERQVVAFVVAGPFYREQIRIPRRCAAEIRIMAYLPPDFVLYKDTDVQICQGGYNTIQELAAAGGRAVVVPATRKIDDQAARARNLAVAGANLRIGECDAGSIVSCLRELLAAPATRARRENHPGDGAEQIADHLVSLLEAYSKPPLARSTIKDTAVQMPLCQKRTFE
jgi:hypothetical protein